MLSRLWAYLAEYLGFGGQPGSTNPVAAYDPAPRAAPDLPCVGCAHSAASIEYPGAPSGERPCCFCVRNPEREAELAAHVASRGCAGDGSDGCRHPAHGYWYNGKRAAKVPADNYYSLDMHEQVRLWLRERGDDGA